MKPSTTEFMNQVKAVIDKGIPVSMVDVYFANGSDNTPMSLMKQHDLLYKVAAYNGWNTASNTIGHAIAQAILAPDMSETDHRDMLDRTIHRQLGVSGVQTSGRPHQPPRQTKALMGITSPTPAMKEEMIAEGCRLASRKMGLDRDDLRRFPMGTPL